MSFGASGGGSQSKSKQNTASTGSQAGTQTSTPQWWGNQTMGQVIPAAQAGFGQLMNLAQSPSNYQFNPQQQANWQQAMSIGQQGNPYQMAGNQYLNPMLTGGWQQYYDQANNASALQAIQGALPTSQEEFIRQATKDLAGTPYATGSNAAALGAGYGTLKLNQAQALAQQYQQQAQQTEAAKSIYGQTTPGVAQAYAGSQDPSSWFNTMNQLSSAPEAYKLQQTGGWGNILGGAAQGLYGMGYGAYTTPSQTSTTGTYADYGRTTGDTQSGGSSGSGSGCCYVFIATDPTDELLAMVRRFKDSHYSRDSYVAHGYKRLALWLVPAMRRNNIVKQIIKYTMVHPMELYAKAFYEKDLLKKVALYPIAQFWRTTYELIGRLYGEKKWMKYIRLIRFWKEQGV